MKNSNYVPLEFNIQKFQTETVHALSIVVEIKGSPVNHESSIKGLACIIDKPFLIRTIKEVGINIDILTKTIFDLFVTEASETLRTYYKLMPQEKVEAMLEQVKTFISQTIKVWTSSG